MRSLDIDAFFVLLIGLMIFVDGWGSVLFYHDPELTGPNMFPIVLGIVAIVLRGFALHQQISRSLTYLCGHVYCIDCRIPCGPV